MVAHHVVHRFFASQILLHGLIKMEVSIMVKPVVTYKNALNARQSTSAMI
jgi:Tat protein secretion system quality control protein TatD with DNase activity